MTRQPSIPLTAHGIARTGLAKVSGRHISEACNEPEPDEAAWIAADLAEDVNKSARRHAVSDAYAMDLQVQFQGFIGELPA